MAADCNSNCCLRNRQQDQFPTTEIFSDIEITDADSTVLLPEGLGYEQAAPIFCAGYGFAQEVVFAQKV
jgi:D-arabinose 1-dehydrogenase-like Zn-dependent alcohol dehydrogenase